MSLVAGADGCSDGWICICRDTRSGEIISRIFQDAESLIFQTPTPQVLMIDIPIGLPNAGSRACDVEARRLVKTRRSSVFPAPVRPAIGAQSHVEASRLTEQTDGRRVAGNSPAGFTPTSRFPCLAGYCGSPGTAEVYAITEKNRRNFL